MALGARIGPLAEVAGDVFCRLTLITPTSKVCCTDARKRFEREGRSVSGFSRTVLISMHARAQGTIMVECVVQTTGVCTNIRVTRSLNPAFGLDQEAIKAAAQWRFRPGTRQGKAVPVLVTMEIAFATR